jgi:succinate dehydrogenase / fumarate reductase flavoprotein subunit
MGILITEGVRGEGGVLLNNDGARFMDEYAPTVKDLASRDVVSRAMYLEMKNGRGIGGKRYLYLDATPATINKYAEIDGRTNPDGSPYKITGEQLLAKLPDIVDFCRTYLGVDPITQPMPVQPTAHYTMGGIPTNKFGEVVIDDKNTVFPGLYSAGEVACVSVHGANRLGTNSLLDLVVFGKHAGLRAAEFAQGADFVPLPDDPTAFSREQIDGLTNGSGKENVFDIGNEMKSIMFDDVGVFRTEEGMKAALAKVNELQERFKEIKVQDTGKIFNTELLNAWEMANLLDMAEVITASALNREESRGGHARDDFPERDDENWLKHTLVWKKDGKLTIGYKPVVMTRFEPKKRVY